MGSSYSLDIKIAHPAAVPLITMLCRLAGIRSAVDHMVAWNDSNSRISPGLLIETLITCLLCDRRPLWKIHQFWAEQDIEALFAGIDISLAQLNDDAYGRALDKLAETNMELLVSQVALNMLAVHNLGIRTDNVFTDFNHRNNRLAQTFYNRIAAII